MHNKCTNTLDQLTQTQSIHSDNATSHPEIELAGVGRRGQVPAHVIVLLQEDTKQNDESGKKGGIEKVLEKSWTDVDTTLDKHSKVQFIAIVN